MPESDELFIPTMTMSSDLLQISVRKSFMVPDAAEEAAVCSHEGASGWTKFMPNSYAAKVIAPLVEQQQEGEVISFADFLQKHLPGTPLPEALQIAHSSVFSVQRSSIHRHPKSFYEALLADARDSSKPYQALYIEAMWWYIFHGADVPCPRDLPASRERRLQSYISVLSPQAGDIYKFGQVMPISWTHDATPGITPFRLEIWQAGDFMTRIEDRFYTNMFEWMVTTDASDPDWKSTVTKTLKQTKFNLEPGSKYTIRICNSNLDELYQQDDQMCDQTYGESGEFDIVPTVTMLEPSCGSTFSAPEDIQVVRNSFYIPLSTVTVGL